jgi:hypothetical protein
MSASKQKSKITMQFNDNVEMMYIVLITVCNLHIT